MTVRLDERVELSVDVLEGFLRGLRISGQPKASPLVTSVTEGLTRAALGGKHLRSRLVHIAAGDVQGPQLTAATVFGACVDLLHGAFLVHDDLIDRDDTRRGHQTIHAEVRDAYGDEHVGNSIAVVAGDLGINSVFKLLTESELEDRYVRSALRILTSAAEDAVIGELLDVSHLVEGEPTLEDVRVSNTLKTGHYSFVAPLRLGALAAGRELELLDDVAHHLGVAYQAADDIAGSVGSVEETGKSFAGDLVNNRATLVTLRMAPGAPALPDAVSAVIVEGEDHLNHARESLAAVSLEPEVRVELAGVIDEVGRRLHAHA